MTDADTGTNGPTGTAGSATPPPPPTGGPRRLVRRTDDRMVAGVASGLADYLGIDPAIVRIVFVVLAFVGAAGFIAYGACWLLIPEADEPAATPPRIEASGAPFWIGVGLLGLAAILFVNEVGGFTGRSILTPLVLIGLGVALWKVSQDRQTTRVTASWPTSSAADATDHQETVEMDATTASGQTWTPPPVPERRGRGGGPGAPADRGLDWTPPPAPPSAPSFLGRLTVALAFIVVGGAVALDQLDLVAVTYRDGAALAMLVVGLGLVVGTWFGRARWLSLIGLVLVPVVVATSLAQSLDIPLSGGFGERFITPVTVSELEPSYQFGAGEFRLDLTEFDLPSGTTETSVRLGAGELTVLVPDDVRVEVNASAQVGELDIDGDGTIGGTGLDRSTVLGPADATSTVVLDLRVGAGEITVLPVETEQEFTR